MRLFATVGTDHHPFDRLLNWIAEALDRGILPSTKMVTVQTGYTSFIDARMHMIDFMPFPELAENVRTADIVVTHASSVAILACHEGKIPIVVPREKRYGEHVDDHQLNFVMQIGGRLPFMVVLQKEEFMEALRSPRKASQHVSEMREKSARSVKKFESAFKALIS